MPAPTTPTQLRRDIKVLRDPRLTPNRDRTRDLEARLFRVLDRAARARSSTPDGYPTATTGGGAIAGSGPGSTTERAALDRADPATTGAEVDKLIRQAFDFLAQASTSIGALLNTLDKLDRLSNPDKGPGQVAAVCCEPHCEDLATGRHAGRCEPCWKWRSRNGGPDAGPVPQEVIQDRLLRRGTVGG